MNQYFKRLTALCLLAAMIFGLVGGVRFPKAAATDADSTKTENAVNTNLLQNPGFEELNAKNEPVGWSVWGSKAHTIVDANSNPDEVFDGRYALKVTDSSSTASVGVQSELFPIEAGVSYRLSVYAMELTKGSTFQAYIYFGHMDSETGKFVRDTAFYVNTTGTGEWNYCEVTGIAPGVSTHARVLLVSGGAATGTTCYDYATFTKVGTAAYMPEAFDGKWEVAEPEHPRMDFDKKGLEDIIAFSQSDEICAYGYSGASALQTLLATADQYLAETQMTLKYQEVQITFPMYPVLEDPTCREEFDKSPAGYALGYPYMTGYGSNIISRVRTLALAYALTGELTYGQRAKQYVMDMCSWQYWTGYCESIQAAKEKSSQGTGYIVDAVATVYDLCRDLFTEEELAIMETQMIEKGLEAMYADCMPRMLRGQDMEQGTGLILGACAIVNEDNIQQMKKYLDMGMTYINWRLEQFLKSGVNEGNMYDALGIDDIMVALSTLKRVTGYEGPFSHPYMEEMAKRVLGFFEMTKGVLPAYSDSEFKSYYPHAMAVLSQQGNDLATYYLATSGVLSSAYDKLVWYSDKSLAELEIPDDRIGNVTNLKAHGQGALRTGWGTLDSLLVINANNSQMEHNHYDQNSILLAFNGKWMLTDSEYKDNAYTTLTTWELKYTNSTIFVDGRPQISRGKGSLEQVFNTHVYGYLIGSAPGAYGLEDKQSVLNKFDRHVIMLNHDSKPYYIIIDDLDSNKERSFGWNFYTNGKLKIDDEAYTGYWDRIEMDGVAVENGTTATGNRLTLSNHGCTLHSYFVGAQVTTRELSYLTHGPTLLVENSKPSKNYQFMNVLSMEQNTANQYTTKFADLVGQDGKITLKNQSGTSYEVGNVANMDMLLFCVDGDANLNGTSISLCFDVPEDGAYFITLDMGQTMTTDEKYNFHIEGIDNDQDGNTDYLARGNSFKGPEGIYILDCGKQYLTAGEHTLRIVLSGQAKADATLAIGAINLRKANATMGEGTVKVLESYDNGDLLGAKIAYGPVLSDLVLFNRGTGVITGGGLTTNGQQATVLGLNGTDISEGYAVTNGTSLKYGDLVLMTANGPVSIAVDYTMAKLPVKNGEEEPEIHKDFNELDPVFYISSKAEAETTVSFYLGMDVNYTAMVDGVAVASTYDVATGMLTMTVPAGEHQITVSGGHHHAWVNADCVTPKTCSLCGLTEGEPLGHTWIEATCTTNRVCSACGLLGGGPVHMGIEGNECLNCGKVFGYCSENIAWTLDSKGVLTISGYGAMPDFAQGKAPWYNERASVTSIAIEDGITKISQYAFYNCTKVTNVTMSDDVTEIGNSAFRGCTGLTTLTVGAGVTSIADRAFWGCSALKTVNICAGLASIGSYAFYSCNALADVVYCGTDEQWEKITIGSQNAKLTGATLSYHAWMAATCIAPKTCAVCGKTEGDVVHAWVDATCTSPKTCTICGATEGTAQHNVVDEICTICSKYGTCGDNLIWTLENGVLTVSGTGAMKDYGNKTENFAPWYEMRNSITSIVVEEGVTAVGRYAFLLCKYATKVVISDTVTFLRYACFHQCSGFTEFAVGKNVTTIEAHVFAGCSKLETVNIPATVKSIASQAFRLCNNLKTVNYCGTAAQWSAITIASLDNDTLVNATRNYHVVTAGSCTEDKVCTICGAIVEKATGHAYESAVTAPTCVAEGYTTYTCACGESYVDNKVPATGEHTYVDGACSVCGAAEEVAPTIDENLTIVGKDMLLGGYIGAQFTVNPEVTGNYDSVYIVVVFDGQEFTYNVPLFEGAHVFEHRVAPKYMGEALQITAYGVKGEEVIPGVTVEWSIKDGIMERLAKFYPYIKYEQYKNRCILLVDMLYYGAEAQVRFNTNGNGLVTDDLDAGYAALKTATEPTIEKVNTATKTSSNQLYQVNLGVEDAVQMQFTFRLKVEDYSQYLVKITANGITYEYTGESFIPQGETSTLKKFVTVVFDKLEAVNMRDEITVELWQNGALVSASYTMSIEGFATASTAKGENVALLKAMIAYGDSAKVSLG